MFAMNENFTQRISKEVEEVKESGLYKTERVIESPQGAEITVNGKTVLNFCANNYLGLSSHPEVIAAAHKTIDERGYGMSSVRFICGTQDIHKELEKKISAFLGTEGIFTVLDRIISFVLCWMVIKVIPPRTLVKFGCGSNYIKKNIE